MKPIVSATVREKCWIFMGALVLVSFVDVMFSNRLALRPFFLKSKPEPTKLGYILQYEPCKKIPAAPPGIMWPEEAYRHDPECTDVLDLANASRSQAWIHGTGNVILGDKVEIKMELYNGRGEKKTKGGDLVRVWLRESSLGAASVARVFDHGNGSYTATLKAFWIGQPEVRVVIISPREVIAAAFKRRYKCPPVLMNTAIFQHPNEDDVTEETPCNYDDHVPDYVTTCNLTEENYGRPWYCGKPRHPRLMCEDWVMTSDVNLWTEGVEQEHLSQITLQLFSLEQSTRIVPTNIRLNVTSADASRYRVEANENCGSQFRSSTWQRHPHIGYLYNNSWTWSFCQSYLTANMTLQCLRNTRVRLIGDSTMRQIFEKIQASLTCQWITDNFEKAKHRPAMCHNSVVNFTLSLELPPLPFCTYHARRQYFKSFGVRLNAIADNEKTITVFNVYAHVLNYHSHVFYDIVRDMRSAVLNIVRRNKRAHIVIKGPHAYSFSKSTDHVIWMPDAYADIYSQFLYDQFMGLHERVVYLNALDITIATEQWHIHAEDYVIQELVSSMFHFVC